MSDQETKTPQQQPADGPPSPRKKKKARKAEKKPRKKREPSAYALFIKEHYHTPDCLALPCRSRLGYLAKLWKQQQAK